MHWASGKDHKDVVQVLLQAGAATDARDEVGLGGRDIYLSLWNGT